MLAEIVLICHSLGVFFFIFSLDNVKIKLDLILASSSVVYSRISSWGNRSIVLSNFLLLEVGGWLCDIFGLALVSSNCNPITSF